MKKCSTNPDFKLLEFTENPQRENIYDLVSTSANFDKFRYFRLQEPRADYLIRLGAKYIIENWEGGVKILHTGLIPIGKENYYFGDYTEYRKGKKINSLMLVYKHPTENRFKIWFFNGFNKKSILMKLEFLQQFVNGLVNI